MKLHFIDTGYFYADGGAMFGAIPKTAWQRRYPCNESNACILAMRSALFVVDDRIILIDTGAGDKHLKQLSYYKFFDLKDLGEELQKLGYTCEQVTDVVLTHLHFDHCGYSTIKNKESGKLSAAFPNAKYWVSRSQWDNFNHPNALEKDSYFTENMQAVADADLLHLLDTDTFICPEIELRIYDGHTAGQLVPYLQMPERTVVFAGDVIPLAASVSPEWISAYDTNPVISYNEKIRMLDEAANERQALVFCHDAYTKMALVKSVGRFFKPVAL
ncbi:MBL fold metallo-hydrolase [Parabacteroides bouchesdurhonensis]|uniref:MBL fold metallo-hydrolase n=1 Tax=Parabacteroides bouchesdurhonensis TaxID=1936995 RepID=UPI000C825A11|nr:MBL fold metallo-hydrolase [Parabacteroides bouchesdurhonensis]